MRSVAMPTRSDYDHECEHEHERSITRPHGSTKITRKVGFAKQSNLKNACSCIIVAKHWNPLEVVLHFVETGLKGAWLIEPECHNDERGFFARSFCAREFAEQGLPESFVQCNISFNHRQGTLRGMHFQQSPHEEAKLVRCTMGAIHDIIVDLRPDSPTHLQHFAVELSAENRRQLFVPKGFAHGFQTLADNTEVFYQMSDFFVPGVAAGVRYDDPKLGLNWPLPISVIAAKDLELPVLP